MNKIDTIILLTTMIIVVVGFIALFVFHRIKISKTRKHIQDELSGKEGVYDGPSGEPLWNGKLPEKVYNYTEPRYVYENLVETTEFQPQNGRIIGYRISPSLVIHSRVQLIKPSSVALYRDRFGGKLLEFSDVKALVSAWQEVSKLRVTAGDTPLNAKFIYATRRGTLVICKINNMTWEEASNLPNLDVCFLILKR